MIARIIEFSARNKVFVLAATAILLACAFQAMKQVHECRDRVVLLHRASESNLCRLIQG